MSSSSGHNLNSFPYFPSSSTSYNLPLTLPSLHNYESLGNNNNNNIFNIHQPHQHQDPVSFLTPYLPISHHYSQLSAAATPDSFINFAVSNNIQLQSLGNIPDLLAKSAPAAAAKKDRHSKIYTAQGLRDRRVRLSIDIARKFFDLQDMLGYDKASKTLEWLFGKSRKAIKELSKTKNGNVCFNGGKKVSLVSDIENPDDNDDDDDDDEDQGGSGLKRDLEEKPSKVEVFQQLPARESRAKARVKAREKQGREISNQWKILDSNLATSENSIEESSMIKRKLCAKKFIDDTKMSHHENEISQWKLLDQIKASKGLILEEPSMIKRKFRPSIISGSSQRNLVFSFDSIPINFTQNWDTNNNPNCPFNK